MLLDPILVGGSTPQSNGNASQNSGNASQNSGGTSQPSGGNSQTGNTAPAASSSPSSPSSPADNKSSGQTSGSAASANGASKPPAKSSPTVAPASVDHLAKFRLKLDALHAKYDVRSKEDDAEVRRKARSEAVSSTMDSIVKGLGTSAKKGDMLSILSAARGTQSDATSRAPSSDSSTNHILKLYRQF